MRIGAVRILRTAAIGTIASVLGAMAFALHLPHEGHGIVERHQLEIDCWRAHAPLGSPQDPPDMYLITGVGARILDMHCATGHYPGGVQVVMSGWPMFSLWGFRTSTPGATGLADVQGVTSFRDPFRQGHLILLPIRPVWIGAAVNAVTWSAGLLALWEGMRAIRRWDRRRKGRCDKCGYFLNDRRVCPECGALSVRTEISA